MAADSRMRTSGRTQFHISGASLKNMAYISMFIDHFFAIIILNYLWMTAVDGVWDPGLTIIYRAGRALGRVAFILFAHQIVEGFLYTRSRGRFLLRLGIFAIVSEIPFDLAFSGQIIDLDSQNIFFTLLTGVLVLIVWESLARYRGVIFVVVRGMALAAGCLAAYLGNMDYRYMGILLIFGFYMAHDRKLSDKIILAGCVMLFGTWSGNCLRYLEDGYTVMELFRTSLREMYGLAAFIPLAYYNGQKGRQLPKWFSYGFYPVHLLFLYGAAKYIGVM